MDGNRTTPELTRRHFIVTAATAAGGLMIGISALPHFARAATVLGQPWNDDTAAAHEIDAWIVIDPDDSVLIRYQRSEMGQGSMTAVPMMLNEELQADWSKVRIEYASANRNHREKKVYGDQNSNGSRTINGSQPLVQKVGASARQRLITVAATRWNVPVSECTSASSVVTHGPSGRTLRYGELAADAAKVTLAAEPAIKTPDQFTFIGKPMPRVDVIHKTNGSAKFGMDAQVPGMVFAAVLQCPVPGGKLKSVDESVVAGMPGNPVVVKLADAVAVAAEGTWWRARQALGRLQPEWDVGAAGNTDSAQFFREYHAALDGPAATARKQGDVNQAVAGSKTFEAVYETPYLSHSPMEPMNATVHLQDGRLDVWVGTQDAYEATEKAAKFAGLEPEEVFLHNAYVGGGFGRRDVSDEIGHAIAVAKVVKKPVKLIWSREEDTRHDRMRPMAVTRFKGVTGADGMPTALSIRTVAGSIVKAAGIPLPPNGVDFVAVAGLAGNGYASIPNVNVDYVLKDTHLPVWWWRAPGMNQNIFALESFVDEMATANGQDPYQFRRKMLAGKADWLAVLDLVAEKGDWGKPLPKGTGRGIAICDDAGSLCAQVAEVTVTPKGEVKVNRVTVVMDTHYIVNPLGIAEQAEGSVIFGLSAALFGKIEIKNGVAVQGNFDTYRMVRLAEAPKIEVHLLASGGPKWGGAGEPAVPPLSGAVANAIFAATGKRIRSLPIMDNDLSYGTT